MVTALGILLGIVVVIAITALTGYFVAQEFAYMAVDRSRLKARAADGDAAAARALGVTRRTSFMLSGAQLGITVTGLLVGYVAEPLIGSGVGEILGDVGIPLAAGVAIGTVVAVLVSTVVQMVFGELFPKNLAIARPEPVARRLALSTSLYLTIFGPVIRVFDASSNLLLKVLRIEPVHDVEHSATPRDLEHIVAQSQALGELPPELAVLLDRVIDFPTRTAQHAMIPRPRVDHVRADTSLPDLSELMAGGHTRYPVIGERADDVIGIVHLHDVLDALHLDALHAAESADTGPDVPADAVTAADLARPAVVVPTTLALPDVLAALNERGHDDRMAVVIDEYGGVAGVITVEDIAEEMVGEIDDEHDPQTSAPIEIVDDGWLISGSTALDEVSRAIGHDLVEGDHETLGGLVIHAAGGLPAAGDRVTLPVEPIAVPDDGSHRATVSATVVGIDRRVPSLVRVAVDELGAHR